VNLFFAGIVANIFVATPARFRMRRAGLICR
jgi:hypothetical protein